MLNKNLRQLVVSGSILAAGSFPLAGMAADAGQDGYQPRTRLSRPGSTPVDAQLGSTPSNQTYSNDSGNYPQNDLGIPGGAMGAVNLPGTDGGQPKSKLLQGGIDRSAVMPQQNFDLSTAQQALQALQGAADSRGPMSTGVGQTDLNGGANQRLLQGNAGQGALRGGTATPAPLTAGTSSTRIRGAVEQFKDHDVCLIIDRSSSMSDRDCPGGLSRWEWCGQQSGELAQAAQMAASNLTVMVFSGTYDVYEHVNPMLIPRIFMADHPHGTTNLSLPLQDSLNRYFSKRGPNAKPLIVAVITDGLPWDFGAVEGTIINAANHTERDGEVSITFMLIGQKWNGLRRMEELDSDLVQMGARRDIVNLVEFDSVMQLGAKQALAEALSGRQLRNNMATGPRLPFDQDGPMAGGGSLKSLLNGLQQMQNMGMVPPMNGPNSNGAGMMFGGKTNPFLK